MISLQMNSTSNKIGKTSQVSNTCEFYENNDSYKTNLLIILAYFLILGILIPSCSSKKPKQQTKADFFNSFESKRSIKNQFRLDKIERNGWSLSSVEKTEGDYGLAISLNDGDKSNGKTERAEIQDPKKIEFDKEVWYRLDFKIPENFPEIDTRMVFWQLKQNGGNNPLLSMRYRNGKLSIKQRFSNHQINYKPSKSYLFKKNIWKRLVMQTYISKSEKGFVNIYLDDQLIVSYRGRTGYISQDPRTYFKFGIYRDNTEEPMTMYFDNYIRGSSWQEVVPEGGIVIPERQNLWQSKVEILNKE